MAQRSAPTASGNVRVSGLTQGMSTTTWRGAHGGERERDPAKWVDLHLLDGSNVTINFEALVSLAEGSDLVDGVVTPCTWVTFINCVQTAVKETIAQIWGTPEGGSAA